MRIVLFGLSALFLASVAWKPLRFVDPNVTLVVAGDVHGYLAPCGCTKPMVGGIKRWSKGVRDLQAQGKTIVIVNGGLAGGIGRQQELKVESLAESFRSIGVKAVNLTHGDAELGMGTVSSVARLSGGALSTMSIEPRETIDIPQYVEASPFLIGGCASDAKPLSVSLGASAIETEVAVAALLEEASIRGLKPVLMWSGDENSARNLAKKHPGLVAIVYSSTSVPKERPLTEGSTWLLTPGEKGRALVSATWDGTRFVQYRNVPLGPEVQDDPEVGRYYARYLERVNREGLLMKMARPAETTFAGSEACAKCHPAATKVWERSSHSKALATLEKEGHDLDPDCVGCHVVGLDSVNGFMSRPKTPQLANVGCESCHGPARAHVMNPREGKLGKVGEQACQKCHSADHSPNFQFETFWNLVRH